MTDAEQAVVDLQAPPELGTGEVQVTLLWASGDDLDLIVTDPNGERINYQIPTSSTGAALDADNEGGECGDLAERAENVFWATNPPAGTYRVETDQFRACAEGAAAKIQVRIGGALVIDQPIIVGAAEPIEFTVGGAPAGFRSARALRPAVERANVAPAADLPARKMPRALELECEDEGAAEFSMNPNLQPFQDVTYSFKDRKAVWDVKAGVIASVSPSASISGSTECEITGFPSIDVPIAVGGVPLVLSFTPLATASAEGSISLEGPEFALTMGMRTHGHVYYEVETCAFIPCGVEVDQWVKVEPIADFTVGEASVNMEAEFEVNLGVKVQLMVGIDNWLFVGKAGLDIDLAPISAALEASTDLETVCVQVELGFKIDIGVSAEVEVIGLFDVGDRWSIWDDRFAYPGAEFELGQCDD